MQNISKFIIISIVLACYGLYLGSFKSTIDSQLTQASLNYTNLNQLITRETSPASF